MAAEFERTDTVAISRRAVQLFTALVTAGLVWVGTVFWELNLEYVRHSERLAKLEEFGPKSGERFTANDGRQHGRRLSELEAWRHAHEQWGREKVGEWHQLHKDHMRRINRLEKQIVTPR